MSARAIIAAWLAVDAAAIGRVQADAITDLNESLGARYTVSRIGEWRDDRRPMPSDVREYMIAVGIAWLLDKHGIDADDEGDNLDALAADLA